MKMILWLRLCLMCFLVGFGLSPMPLAAATPQNSGDLARIEVTPQNPNIRVGDQQQFTANGFDQAGNEMSVTPTWTTSGGSISQSGEYTATESGDFTVTATVEGSGVSGTARVTVYGDQAAIEDGPAVGARIGLTGQGRFAVTPASMTPPSGTPANTRFPFGLLDFSIIGLSPGAASTWKSPCPESSRQDRSITNTITGSICLILKEKIRGQIYYA